MNNNNQTNDVEELMNKLLQVKEYIHNDVPVVIGVEGVRHFKNSFQIEAFDGNKWAPRKTQRSGSTNNQKTLTRSGELAEAIDYKIEGSEVVFVNDKPYAEVHNEGASGTQNVPAHTRDIGGRSVEVAAHSRTLAMPQRRFIGWTKELEERITDKVGRDINKIINP